MKLSFVVIILCLLAWACNDDNDAPVVSQEIHPDALHPQVKAAYDVLDAQFFCDLPRQCGPVVKISCHPEVDGPLTYFDNELGDVIMYCGGACMVSMPADSKRCVSCPPDQWVCDVQTL